MEFHLKDFGSYFIGGNSVEITEGQPEIVNFTRTANYNYDPRGHHFVGQAYVQYFVPQNRLDEPPVVLVHGGGMTGTNWETTPDGRLGWIQLLLKRGYEVHVIDNVERGRSGFAPEIYKGKPITRTHEEAWELFRFGKPENFESRLAFDKQLFPTEHFDHFTKSIVPRWLTNSQLQVDALTELLDQLGTAILITHSQGGEVGFDAAKKTSAHLAKIIALEPSGWPLDLTSFKNTELILLAGDYLDCADHWSERRTGWQKLIHDFGKLGVRANYIDLKAELKPGNSHMIMMDQNNEDCLELAFSN